MHLVSMHLVSMRYTRSMQPYKELASLCYMAVVVVVFVKFAFDVIFSAALRYKCIRCARFVVVCFGFLFTFLFGITFFPPYRFSLYTHLRLAARWLGVCYVNYAKGVKYRVIFCFAAYKLENHRLTQTHPVGKSFKRH